MRAWWVTVICLLGGMSPGGAANPEVREATPAEQAEVFEALAARTFHAEKATDAEGNIIFVCFNQHDRYRSRNPEAPGLNDEDLKRLRSFPKLEGVTLQRQPLTDAGFEVLRAFPGLKVASLVDLATNKEQPEEARPTFAMLRHLDGARGLQVLDLTHSFRMPDEPDALAGLQGFPDLEVLVVDVGISDDPGELLPFIRKSPKLKRLKLHRTTLSDAEMAEIFAACPELEWLEMKPKGNTPGERWSYQSLRMIPGQSNLKVLRLIHGDALPLPWENGLEHLAGADTLKVLMFPEPDAEEEDRAVKEGDLERLRAARPDLLINPSPDSDAVPPKPNPAPYEWEIGPR